MVLIRVGNDVSQGPDSLQIFQKRVRYYSGWGYEQDDRQFFKSNRLGLLAVLLFLPSCLPARTLRDFINEGADPLEHPCVVLRPPNSYAVIRCFLYIID
jgi:hypothetical protein